MAVNRRLIFWLIRAYIQKWGKAIFAFFILGLVIFFLLQFLVLSFITKLTSENKKVIGTVGTYTVYTLPTPILTLVSQGLTSVSPDGTAHPDLASSWEITDSGKTYTLHLKSNQKFSDGTPFTSTQIATSFTGVTTDKPNDSTIIYHLKEPYAPFLVTLSRPIFKNGFVGVGPYKVSNVTLNGNFVQSISLTNIKIANTVKIFQFYPTSEALKLAFALGEISLAQDVSSLDFQQTTLSSFPNVTIVKSTDYSTLVTLFYDTTDKVFSDPKLREAFSYTMPDTFAEGERAYSPLSPLSWAYQNNNPHTLDYQHARLLLQASLGTDTKTYPVLTISTLEKYRHIAQLIQTSWAKLGIKTTIQIVPSVPSSFQIYLGDFHVSLDPDQYTLWHSYQSDNITNLNKDVRIDKLLEDGRKTLDKNQRITTYWDFQKYLINDQPATFLYFPYSYTLTRK